MFRKPLPLAIVSGPRSGAYGTFRSKVLVVFLIVSLIFSGLHAQRARAFGPILIYPGIQLVTSAAGVFSLALTSSVIGVAIYALRLRDKDNANSVPIEVRINPKDPAVVPSGWSGAQDPASDPNPPQTVGAPDVSYSVGAGGNLGTGNTASIACSAFASKVQTPDVCSSQASVNGNVCNYYLQQATNGPCVGPFAEAIVQNQTCPTGYSVVSGVCTLTNAAVVRYPSDGKCRMKATSGGVISVDSKDPDCDGPLPQNVVLTPDGKTIEVKDGNRKTRVAIELDNSLKVEEWEGNGDGTSIYRSASISAPDSGSASGGAAVTGVSSGRVIGEGSLAGSGDTAQPESGSTPRPCGAPGQPPCRIDETGTPSPSVITDALNAAKSALDSITPATFGRNDWQGTPIQQHSGLPSVSGSALCVNPITWVWMGHTLHPDICSIWAPLKGWLEWFLYAFTAVYIWRRGNQAIGGA